MCSISIRVPVQPEQYDIRNTGRLWERRSRYDTDSSDVDLLVDVGSEVGLVTLAALERELEEILGRKVDVVPADSVKPALASEVLAQGVCCTIW